MSNLAILETSIRSYENLFSLNDLHQASGNLAKHKPVLFLRLETTKDLIAEIEQETPNATKTIRGTQGGTYACEELVIAYAMWISPKFHLVVLRAFLNLHKNQTALLPNTITPEQQQAIQSAVQQAHHRTGLHYQEIYRQLKAMFHVAKYDQLPQDQFGNAMAFITNLQPVALPAPTITADFTVDEVRNLINTWTLFTSYEESINHLLNAAAPFIYGHAFSSAQLNHQWSKSALMETFPTIKRLMEQLPEHVKLHQSRQQIAHKYSV